MLMFMIHQSGVIKHICEVNRSTVPGIFLLFCVSFNCADEKISLLHESARTGNVETVKTLLDEGLHPDVCRPEDRYAETALQKASLFGHLSVVQCLLDHGASVTAQSALGTTAFHRACKGGSVNVLPVLLQDRNQLEAKAKNGLTPLFMASEKGQLDTVKWLIEAGADIDACNDKGHTPLHAAAQYDHPRVGRQLCLGGASVGTKTKNNNTPVHHAAFFGQLPVLRTLVEEHGGYQYVFEPGWENLTPLQMAEKREHPSVVEYLQQLKEKGLKATAAKGICLSN